MEGAITIGQQAEITCQFFFSSVKNPTLTWNLNNKNLPGQVVDMTVFETDGFNATRVVSALEYNFTRVDGGMNLTCTAQERPFSNNIAVSASILVELLCEC